MIFSLPFHITRFFRPTFLEVFQLSNTQLGDIFALYGVVAMLTYFPGGAIADHFSARKLLVVSLIATSLGGFYLYTIPSVTGLYLVFAYFGLTSILLFWAALIKATREWGGDDSQGVAFGFLDGGRGLIASIAASVAVFVFTLTLAEQLTDRTKQIEAVQAVVAFYSFATLLAALLVWFFIPDTASVAKTENLKRDFKEVVTKSTVWLQGGIIIAAYCGFKALDNYGIYAVQVLGMDAVESAKLTTFGSYSRPFAAILAGVIADRWLAGKLTSTMFTASAVLFLTLASLQPSHTAQLIIVANLFLTFIAVFALRAIYFALLEESKLKTNITGTAVGLISVIGFTPDIFFAPITGRVLDANPGYIGFQYYFLIMTGISIFGLVMSYRFTKQLK